MSRRRLHSLEPHCLEGRRHRGRCTQGLRSLAHTVRTSRGHRRNSSNQLAPRVQRWRPRRPRGNRRGEHGRSLSDQIPFRGNHSPPSVPPFGETGSTSGGPPLWACWSAPQREHVVKTPCVSSTVSQRCPPRTAQSSRRIVFIVTKYAPRRRLDQRQDRCGPVLSLKEHSRTLAPRESCSPLAAWAARPLGVPAARAAARAILDVPAMVLGFPCGLGCARPGPTAVDPVKESDDLPVQRPEHLALRL